MNRSQSGWTDNYATDQGSYGYDAVGNLTSDSRNELRYREPLVYEKQRL